MEKVALYVKLEAKPGKEKDLEKFLKEALPLVQQELGTLSWYAIKMGGRKFGIFDTFEDDANRKAHLSGKVAEALMAKTDELLATRPHVEMIDLLAVKALGKGAR